jgi:hypothetical protein
MAYPNVSENAKRHQEQAHPKNGAKSRYMAFGGAPKTMLSMNTPSASSRHADSMRDSRKWKASGLLGQMKLRPLL